MHACTYVCYVYVGYMYIYTYIYMYIFKYIRVIPKQIHVSMSMCIHAWRKRESNIVCGCKYVCMYLYICTDVYVCICIHIHIYMHARLRMFHACTCMLSILSLVSLLMASSTR